jgi:hypothetical protein
MLIGQTKTKLGTVLRQLTAVNVLLITITGEIVYRVEHFSAYRASMALSTLMVMFNIIKPCW